MLATLTPADFQAGALAWIGVAVVILTALTPLMIKVANMARDLNAAWAKIHANTAAITQTATQVDTHERALNGDLDKRIAQQVEHSIANSIVIPAAVSAASDGHSSISGTVDPHPSSPSNPGA